MHTISLDCSCIGQRWGSWVAPFTYRHVSGGTAVSWAVLGPSLGSATRGPWAGIALEREPHWNPAYPQQGTPDFLQCRNRLALVPSHTLCSPTLSFWGAHLWIFRGKSVKVAMAISINSHHRRKNMCQTRDSAPSEKNLMYWQSCDYVHSYLISVQTTSSVKAQCIPARPDT